MSEQVDRIWVQGYTATQGHGYFFDHPADGFDVEYVRADIAASQLAAAVAEARREGLKDAARMANRIAMELREAKMDVREIGARIVADAITSQLARTEEEKEQR